MTYIILLVAVFILGNVWGHRTERKFWKRHLAYKDQQYRFLVHSHEQLIEDACHFGIHHTIRRRCPDPSQN